jgi:RNA polymerase sigma-70 factor (ECF subfamily)
VSDADLTSEDEPSLIRGFLARRDEATFREIYRRQTPTLYRVAVRLAWGSAVRAEDVVQETWLRAIVALPQFRFEASLRTWLVAVVLNVFREMTRPRAEVIPFESLTDEIARADGDPAALAEHDLGPLLGELPVGYRTVLVLHDLEGFTHAEISRALGIAEGTAKSQLSRARAAARALLGESPADRHRRLT